MVKAIKSAEPAVVNIQGNKTITEGESGGDGKAQTVNGMGTGIIIDPRGYIITNLHVVQNVNRIEVTLADGSLTHARMLTYDPNTDLALIKIESDRTLPVIPVGTSRDLMRGETVIAIGNPFGYQHTVTQGIISALHRNVQAAGNGTQEYRDLIQTNADINPGNSGGPLVNIDGEMIGINVAVRMGAQGIGFAIPVDSAMDVAADLIAQSQRNTNHLGMSFRTAYEDNTSFVEVASTKSNFGDQEIQVGDHVISIAGREIHNRLDVELALLGHKAGEELEVVMTRDGSNVSHSIALSSASPSGKLVSENMDEIWDRVGVRVVEVASAELPANRAQYKGGLKVVEVRKGGPAALTQIKVGDIMVGAMSWKTPSVEQLNWVLNHPEFKRAAKPQVFVMRGTNIYTGEIGRTVR